MKALVSAWRELSRQHRAAAGRSVRDRLIERALLAWELAIIGVFLVSLATTELAS